MIRVILADDHPVVLLGIKNVLEASSEIRIVATAHSPDSLISCLSRHSCDVLVTDFSMPGQQHPDGLAMLLRLKEGFPTVRIVVLTKIATPALMSPIMQAGAMALVEKSAALKEITTAVQRAAKGQTYFTENTQREFAALGMVRTQVAEPAQLSPREMEVVRLFAHGYSNNQIAEILGVSAKTTSRQKKDAMRKLAARNDAELYAHARDMGLV
jgi:two-component system capsular synthesis response regulator RcsB